VKFGIHGVDTEAGIEDGESGAGLHQAKFKQVNVSLKFDACSIT